MTLDPAVRQRIDALLQANRVVLFMKGSPQPLSKMLMWPELQVRT